jgi:hypothetical protein
MAYQRLSVCGVIVLLLLFAALGVDRTSFGQEFLIPSNHGAGAAGFSKVSPGGSLDLTGNIQLNSGSLEGLREPLVQINNLPLRLKADLKFYNPSGTSTDHPAVAYDYKGQDYLVVFSSFNGSEREIRGTIVKLDGRVKVPSFLISTSPLDVGSDEFNPTVAFQDIPDAHERRFLVAWQTEDSRLEGAILDQNGIVKIPPFLITAPGVKGVDPDASAGPGGRSPQVTRPFMVAYRASTRNIAELTNQIRLARIADCFDCSPGLETPQVKDDRVDVLPFIGDSNFSPHIAYGDPSSADYHLLVYQRKSPFSPTGLDILYRTVQPNFNSPLTLGPASFISSGSRTISGPGKVAFTHGITSASGEWGVLWRQDLGCKFCTPPSSTAALFVQLLGVDPSLTKLGVPKMMDSFTSDFLPVFSKDLFPTYALAGSRSTGLFTAVFSVEIPGGCLSNDLYGKVLHADGSVDAAVAKVFSDNDCAETDIDPAVALTGSPTPAGGGDQCNSSPIQTCGLIIWVHFDPCACAKSNIVAYAYEKENAIK